MISKISNLLQLSSDLHVPEGLVGDGEHVGRHGAERAALVGLDGGPRVEVLDDGVGVDGDEDVGHVGVDLVLKGNILFRFSVAR